MMQGMEEGALPSAVGSNGKCRFSLNWITRSDGAESSSVAAMSAWCSAYGTDANFWSEKAIGNRVCTWLDSTLKQDAAATLAAMNFVCEELSKCLDVLIRSGVAIDLSMNGDFELLSLALAGGPLPQRRSRGRAESPRD